ncbi:MAG TPA: hypothetical protein VEU94_11630, partial [Terriglobales bacterium]|nr:hypothetical protein [Terriglobales bacterium]
MASDFENAGSGKHQRPQPGCPAPLIWYEIASGELAPESTQEYLQHATGCDYCGGLLSNAVSDLREETTAAEARQIAALESARPDWQRRLARQITGKSSSEPHADPWWSTKRVRWFALATAALAVVVIAVQPLQLQIAETLLASAYSDQRPMKLRMAGAKHAEFKVERGPRQSSLDRPTTLLVAEALISIQMGSHPS